MRIAERVFAGRARLVAAGTPEDEEARALVVEKYADGYSGDLSDFRRRAQVVAVDLGG